MGNKVKYGLKNVYYAKQTAAIGGGISFETPVPFPGAVSLSLAALGEITEFYADDILYYSAAQNSGYQGDYEYATMPDSFATDILKEQLDDTAKVLTEYSNVETERFALLFEFGGDQKAVRHVLYNCSVSRPGVSGATLDNTKTPTTSTLTITAAPMANGMVKSKTTAETGDTVYNGWYESVWQPGSES